MTRSETGRSVSLLGSGQRFCRILRQCLLQKLYRVCLRERKTHTDAYSTTVITECNLSVTLEVTAEGKQQWFLTRESGETPADCSCLGGSKPACVTAYAVLKLVDFFGGTGKAALAPFSPRTLAVLFAASAEFSNTSYRRDWLVRHVFWRLARGHFNAGRDCKCFPQGGHQENVHACRACALLAKETPSRWFVVSSFNNSVVKQSSFPWFKG